MKQAGHADEELDQLAEMARALATERYAPLAAEWDRNRTPFPHHERRYLASLGLLGTTQPVEYGGSAAPLTHALVVVEELAKECRSAAFQVFEANTGPAAVLAKIGTPEQCERFLPPIIRGEATMAVAISEASAGSAATDMTTRAKPTDGGYTLNGRKSWISNGGEADYYLVYARITDDLGAKGIGAVIVEADRTGVSFGARERLMGFRTIPSADVILDNVVVPEENLVVPAGSFNRLFQVFSIERLGNTTMSLAIGQAALDRTIAYVTQRTQFGKQLIEFQAIQMVLADMVMQVDSARLLLDRAARNAGTGLPDPFEVSLAKCVANEMAKRVTDLAMQIHGGNGYSEDYGLECLHRDAHGWAIAGGTPAMQRIRIVSELLGRRFDQRR